nr:ribonuclease H-like domain-containing protein [Tanacetum cinerariifolium]
MYFLVVINDFSWFTWVFFLATKDVTSGILKSFITRIENLVDHKVKVIRYDNRTEFKNREMNQFCKMNGILRQNSVARTPQQNEVAKRRNRTLIEAARTMLADSKLSTTFWAEAINTTCYVQNRVLVVKPHNKTLYELFHGRTPTQSFMRPYGCPVTILNTKDHLGKFNGKADKGSRPDWLFDIDALTRTMNYEPIVLGTQSNGFADPKSSQDDGLKPSSDDGNNVDEDPIKENECYDQEKEDNINSTNNVNTICLTINVAGTNADNKLPFDLNMPPLEDVSIFNFLNDDEDDDIVANMNNIDTTIQMSFMEELTFFLGLQVKQKKDGIFICQDKYVGETLKKFRFIEVKNASTPMKTQKPLLKDEDGEEVDVHMYRSMIGSLMYLTSSRPDIMFAVCACAKYQVNLKVSHLYVVKRIFSYLKGKAKKIVRLMMDKLFEMELELILLFWRTVAVKSSNDVTRLQALVDKKRVVVTEAAIRDALHLDDAGGVDCLPNEEIFTELARTGYEKPTTKMTFYKAFFSSQWKFLIHIILQSMSAKRTSWNEFSSVMASAVICLSTGRKFNFSRRVGKRCSGVETPLFKGMIAAREPKNQGNAEEQGDEEEQGTDNAAAEEPVTAVDDVAQDLEILKLKTRVKKLERANKVKTVKLRRLRKVGTSQRIESSNDTLMQDVSNQGREFNRAEDAVKETEEVREYTADTQVEGRQADIYHIDMDHAAKVLISAAAVISSAVPETISAAAIPAVTAPSIKVAALIKATIPSTRRKRRVAIRDPEEESSIKIPTETTSKDKGKDIDWEAAIDHVKQRAKEEPFIQRYQVMKKRPQTEAQAQRNMMMYLKNTTGFTLDYFKGMSYDDIRPIFVAKFNANIEFLLKYKEQIEEEESRAIASINETSAHKAAKRRKLIEEAKEAKSIKKHLQIVPDEDDDVFTEATPPIRKVPVVDY